MRFVVDILREPRGTAYAKLCALGIEKGLRPQLIASNDAEQSDEVRELLRRLGTHVKSRRIVCEWPGTKLMSGTAMAYILDASQAVLSTLTDTVEGLFDWCEPMYPEDLAFLREDGSEWLGSIAHERDAYFLLDDDELRELRRSVPEIATRRHDITKPRNRTL